MAGKASRATHSSGQGAWRLLVLLALAVAVPTACVLWFMNEAVRNTRLAVRQKLIDAYEPPLYEAAAALAAYWQDKADALAATAPDAAPPERFAALAASGLCVGALIRDEAGALAYPAEPPPSGARDTEAPDPWAEARELVEAEDAAGAAELLAGMFSDPEGADARDGSGRLVAPLAGLRALELMADPAEPPYAELRAALAARLNDYSPPAMPAAERRFLMRRLAEMDGDAVEFPTLPAEDLAAEYLAAGPAEPDGSGLTRTALPGVWRLATPDGRAVGLFREEGFLEEMCALAGDADVPGAAVELRPPDGRDDADAFLTAAPGAMLPGWRLALSLGAGTRSRRPPRKRWPGTSGPAC